MADKYREPPHTCPDINKAQARLEELGDLVMGETKALRAELEELRSENEKLRDWGLIWQERAEDAEKEAAAWERKADDLDTELRDANAEVKDLTKQLGEAGRSMIV